jgi:hypothetical protein
MVAAFMQYGPVLECGECHFRWGAAADGGRWAASPPTLDDTGADADAGAGLDDDPDGDPVDAAGMTGGTEDQGVGPGGDPEWFGDLIEQ